MTNDKPTADIQIRALASLQDTVARDLRPDLRGDRTKEFASCATRVLARLRNEIETAPALAATRLDRWRALSQAPALSAQAPSEELRFHADQIAKQLHRSATDVTNGETDAAESLPASAWFREAVSATRDYLDAYEQALPPSATASQVVDNQADTQREKLSAYIGARFPDLPVDPVRSLRIVPGGRGKETSLFELVENDILPTRLVLRRDLALSPTGTTAYAEFPLLKAVEALGLPVPSPILAEKDPAPLGGGFIIMTEVTGARTGGELFAELNDLTKFDASFGPAIVAALAKLHSLCDHPSGGDLGGHASDQAAPQDMVRGFQQLYQNVAIKPPLHVATELGFAWLLATPLPANRPRRLVHGDVGLHNLLVRDGKLAAILDWELTHLGDPAEDIAYAWSPLLRHLMSWQDFTRIYLENGGDAEALDPRAVSWYSVWAHTRNSVYVTLHYDWAASGQRHDIECFSAGIDFFERTQHYIARELDEALRNM